MTTKSPAGALRGVMLTGADANFFPLLRDMVLSTAGARKRHNLDLAVLDFGFDAPALEWLAAQGAHVVLHDTIMGQLREDWRKRPYLPYVTRMMLRELVPGYGLYVWLDADIWLQDDAAVDAFVDGATQDGFAIVAERHPGYRFQAWLQAWTAKHFLLGYGVRGAWLYTKTHFNDGAFAMRADAPQWAPWRQCFEAAYRRSGNAAPHDQFSINQVIHQFGLSTRVLPPQFNWICDRGPPVWDDARACFCTPGANPEPIRVMHLAGPAKHATYAIARSGGGTVETTLRWDALARLRADRAPQ